MEMRSRGKIVASEARFQSRAIAETIQQECLDKFIAFSQEHLDLLTGEFMEHYHHERPHQGQRSVPLKRVTSSAFARVASGVCGWGREGGNRRWRRRRPLILPRDLFDAVCRPVRRAMVLGLVRGLAVRSQCAGAISRDVQLFTDV